MCGCSRDTHRMGVESKGGGMMTPLLQCVARFDEGGEIVGFGGMVTRRDGRGAPCL